MMEFDFPEKKIQLPERESQILRLAGQGMTDKQIAVQLGISQETVGSYWRRVLLRFGASSRTEVVARAAKLEAESHVHSARAEAAELLREIEMRTLAQAQELAQRNLLEAISQASSNFIKDIRSIRPVFDELLAEVLQLTQSEYGFIGEVLFESNVPFLKVRALTNIAWDEDTRGLYERNKDSGFEFRNLDTLFGYVMTSGQTVISNDPTHDTRAGGRPSGHPELNAFLGIPIFAGQQMVGMIGMANRPGGYDEDLVHYLDPLVGTCATIIAAHRSEEDRQKTDEKLQDAAARLRILMDRLTSAVLFEDMNRRVLFVNEAFCTIFGLPVGPKDVVGADCAEAAIQSAPLFRDPKTFLARISEILAADEPVFGEWIHLADGRTLSRDYQIVEVGGETHGRLWMYRDVSERAKDMLAALSILDAALDAVIVVDQTGHVQLWNERASELFGYTREEAMHSELAALIVPERFIEAHRNGITRHGPTGEGPLIKRRFTIEARKKDGSELPVELSITPVDVAGSWLYSAFLRPIS